MDKLTIAHDVFSSLVWTDLGDLGPVTLRLYEAACGYLADRFEEDEDEFGDEFVADDLEEL